MPLIAPWPHFGGKGTLAPLGAPPHYPLIIEPFGGAGNFAYLNADGHRVSINDLDVATYLRWQLYTSGEVAIAAVHDRWPERVHHGQCIAEMVDPKSVPPGFMELLTAFAAVGTTGRRETRRRVTAVAARCWPSKADLLGVIDRVRHWTVTNVSYQHLPNVEATWYIDPPYANSGGAQYRESAKAIDYQELAEWCLTRRGQVIVCEGTGATWLPFEELTTQRGGINSQHRSRRGEVIFHRSPYSVLSWSL